jgi:phage terminase small subunit
VTPKQARFVAEYLIDLNATQAAIRAGYSPGVATKQGPRLLSNARIAAAVAAGKGRQLETAELSALRVLEELRRVAFVDVRGFYDARGRLKPMSALTPEQGSALAGVESMQRNVEAGDGVMDTVYKIKLWDKVRALEALAKHFGLLVDRVHVTGDLDVVAQRLIGARRRLAERGSRGRGGLSG